MITIGIPVFNRPELVKIAVESALRQPQSAAELEILVVDNASTDGTWEVLQSYADPRLRLVRNDRNLGLFGNFNRCFFLARGEYVLTLCSDDALADGLLEPARRLLDARPDVAMVSSRGRATDEVNGRTFPLGSTLPAGVYDAGDAVVALLWALATYFHNPFNYPSGILVRTALAQAKGGMDEALGFGSDVKLYLSILEDHGLAIVDRPGCDVLVHTGAQAIKSFGDPRWAQEFVALFDPHLARLAARGLDGYARAHLGGYLLGTSLRRRVMGQGLIAENFHAEFRRRGYPVLPSLLALADSLAKRSRLRREGPATSPTPVRPHPLPA